MKLLVAVPCYNCQEQIGRVLSKLARDWTGGYDVLVLDNRSQDNTLARAQESLEANHFQRHWKLCKNSSNYGLGGSQKIAIAAAIDGGYDGLIVLHGDDQASPGDIHGLIEAFKRTGSSALGSRFSKGSKLEGYQLMRIIGNRALNFVFGLLCLRKISDLGSGLNLFRTQDLAKLEFPELSDSFNFNVDLLLGLIKRGLPFIFVPITWSETDQVSNARNVKVAISMLKSLFRWRIGSSKKSNLKREELSTEVISEGGKRPCAPLK